MDGMRRIIYFVTSPKIAFENTPGGPRPVGTIVGNEVTVPFTDCPKPINGNGYPFSKCLACDDFDSVDPSRLFFLCKYKQSKKERDELDRKRAGTSVLTKIKVKEEDHPAVTPPVTPDGVFDPAKK